MFIILVLLLSTSTSTVDSYDPDNTCYIDNTCKPTGSVDNPFS